ncbi:MAG: GNAT family N-acetyltransferase [Flavobacteriaceae bacterium]|nr:GNAT family N-acetyltransferase [Flavobacteriaceae bacterium]
MIEIKEISRVKKEMKKFVTFPFHLYKNNKYWVPPIINDEIASFDETKNPVFKNARAHFFLAYKNTKIVGRVAVIINYTEVEDQNIKKIRFGWFDVIDDLEVTKALLNKVYEIGKKNNLEYIEGPIGFSSMDKVGVLTKGFNQIGRMITWYNYPYYENHLKKNGFIVEKEYIESKILIKNIDITKYARYAKLIKQRYNLRELNFINSKKIMPYVDEMFVLFEKAYAKLASFVPISNEQIAFFKKKYISFINPEYIKFVVDKNNNLVAFAIIMPSFAKALQKANGKLFPFGIYHLLKAKKKNDTVISYLIGVDPKYQNKGVISILFEELYQSVVKNGGKNLILTPQLKDNKEVHKIWKNFKPEIIKERSTFRLNIK